MPRLTVKVPKYRHHKASGQAVVKLNGRDVYLGRYGTPESKARYSQLVAEWQVNGRRSPPAATRAGPTVDEVILAYLEHAKSYYVKNGAPTSTQAQIRSALGPFHELYGSSPAASFGPLALKALRQAYSERHGVPAEYPQRAEFERLTRQEERLGLFEEPAEIGFRQHWLEILRGKGLRMRGHRLERAL